MLENLEQDKLEQTLQEAQPQQEIQEPEVKKAAPRQETEKEINLRILRERAEAAERRAYELEYAMKQAQAAQQPQQVVDEDDFAIDDDDVPVGRQIKKQFKSLKNQLKETQARLDSLNQRTSLEQAEIKLNNKFKDFNSIVTQDNIRQLAETDPDAYRGIMANQDMYDRGYMAYQYLSRMTGDRNIYNVEKRLEENKTKPRAAANVTPQTGETPLSRVGDYDRRVLTEDDKDRIRRNLAQIRQYR